MDKGRDRLSVAADALLAAAARDPWAPHYLEESFRRKLEWARRRERALSPDDPRETYLSLSEWAEVIESACLTPVQALVLQLRFEGLTFAEIGAERRASKQAASRIFYLAAKKLARAWHEYPFRGLHEVYMSEIRRRSRAQRKRG